MSSSRLKFPSDKSEEALECIDSPESKSRRSFMCSTASASVAGIISAGSGASLLISSKAEADDFSPNNNDLSLTGGNRATNAANLKKKLANQQKRNTLSLPDQLDNNDENRYQDTQFYASFHKSLPQNEFGEVESSAYKKLQKAMRTGTQQDFNSIPLDSDAVRPLENPQGAFRFEMTGLDSHATRMPPAPEFRSAKTAAEMGEVYWQAITRDVPFINYNTSDVNIADAVADLNKFSHAVGPKENGKVTPNTLFRGESNGDLNGPYISQFLLKDIPYGPTNIIQKYDLPIADMNFMVDPINWINVQRGADPLESLVFENNQKYIFNNRCLGEYVHRDVLFQAYFNAALILLSLGPGALDANNPYLETGNQSAFTSLGGPWLLQMLTYASNLSLSGAWFQKWRVHRRCRPEVYGARVHFNMVGHRAYEIHPDIFNSNVVDRVYSTYGTYFLPMAFTEGSPRHPAYPAGHATVAGACCTVLKAFFNEDFILSDNVQADSTGDNLIPYRDSALTLGGEVNKLANNISIGRDAAGVHYRSDGVDGLVIGEQQAIRLLEEHVRTFNEEFAGFSLTKFDGTKILIS